VISVLVPLLMLGLLIVASAYSCHHLLVPEVELRMRPCHRFCVYLWAFCWALSLEVSWHAREGRMCFDC